MIDKENLINSIKLLVFTLVIMIIVVVLLTLWNEKTNYITSPVEDIRSDTLLIKNELIIEEVNNLDSIKNEHIKEVKNLSNDSTIELFYKLIRK